MNSLNENMVLDFWYTLTPNEIILIDNEELKNLIIKKYLLEIKKLGISKDEFNYFYKNKSIEEIQSVILENEYKSQLLNETSNLFPNKNVMFYPRIKMPLSKKNQLCHFSGSIIKPNNYYYNYRPMLWNKTDNECFVLDKSIKCELAYYDDLPKTLFDFEKMNDFMEEAFLFNNDKWYNFNCNYGNNTLSLKKIKTR